MIIEHKATDRRYVPTMLTTVYYMHNLLYSATGDVVKFFYTYIHKSSNVLYIEHAVHMPMCMYLVSATPIKIDYLNFYSL